MSRKFIDDSFTSTIKIQREMKIACSTNFFMIMSTSHLKLSHRRSMHWLNIKLANYLIRLLVIGNVFSSSKKNFLPRSDHSYFDRHSLETYFLLKSY